MNPSRLLPLLAIVALLLLLMAAAMLVVGRGAPALGAHIAFALGVMPLILAAMGYFVPVLTRGPGAAAASWLPPLMALGGGGLVVAAFATNYSNLVIGLAAFLALGAALGLAAWAMMRARRMIGRRHPGLDWYLAALGMLLMALCAVLAMPWFPDQRAQLRLFHLHANFVGLCPGTPGCRRAWCRDPRRPCACVPTSRRRLLIAIMPRHCCRGELPPPRRRSPSWEPDYFRSDAAHG
jgi:hypothetical protein